MKVENTGAIERFGMNEKFSVLILFNRIRVWEETYRCGNCHYDEIFEYHKYCPNCGEKIDWT